MLASRSGRDIPEETVRTLTARFGPNAVRRQLRALEAHGDVVEEPALWLRYALERSFKDRPIERVRHCPCGCAESTLLGRFVAWNLLGLRRCDGCGLVRVSPRLTAEAMARIFETEYTASRPGRYWGGRRLPIFRRVLRVLERHGARRVFDVGAGFGHFARYARRRGFEVEGCDVSSAMVRWGREEWGLPLHHGRLAELRVRQESYDAVLGLDTLYYVPDPVAELREMARILRPGGLLLLRLRTNRRISRRVRRDREGIVHHPPLPQPHIWAFTPETIAPIVEKAGLEEVATQPAPGSRSAVSPILAAARRSNECLRAVHHGVPIFTPSFHLTALRCEARKQPLSAGTVPGR